MRPAPEVSSADDRVPLSSDEAFGEWFYRRVDEVFWCRRPDWVDAVAQRLQADRAVAEQLRVVVVWHSEMTAFTVPGRYVYVTGRLMEYCPGEAALAFVIAHELAHHDLGHLRLFPR